MRKNSSSTRIFPFAPGIPWKLDRGKYLVPNISPLVWRAVIEPLNWKVVAFGGEFSSYFSLSFLEALSYINPLKKLFWIGNENFRELVRLQGLGTFEKIIELEDCVSNYPVPIFLDKEETAYFNALLNYKRLRPFWGGEGYDNRAPLCKQIFSNSTLEWKPQFIPKLRKLSDPSSSLLQWGSTFQFPWNKPYILFRLTDSIISETYLRGLASVIERKGISVVCISEKKHIFHRNIFYVNPKLTDLFWLISRAYMICSDKIESMLLGVCLSKGKLLTISKKQNLQLNKSMEFLSTARQTITISDSLEETVSGILHERSSLQ